MPRHPVQPVYLDDHGVARFRPNEIVRWLLDNNGKIDLNTIAMQNFSRDEHEHFAQLIGYSVSGFGDLSYVSDHVFDKAQAKAEKLIKKRKKGRKK